MSTVDGPAVASSLLLTCMYEYACAPAQRTRGHAADRVILDRQALAPFIRSCMPHGVPSSWRRNRSPVTVPRAGGENPGQDDPDAAGVLDLDSGPEMGTSPGSSNGPEPGRRPCPGRHGGAGRRGPDHPGRRIRLPRSVHPLSRHHAERRER